VDGGRHGSFEGEPNLDRAFIKHWTRSLIKKEDYWFHKIELGPDLVTPGWDDPKNGKLPYFGLPARMEGMRVLDVGCCEGLFSFEAERRGAKEVIASTHPWLHKTSYYLQRLSRFQGHRACVQRV
jgi:hypothetical protein